MSLTYVSGPVGWLATLKGSPTPITANLKACFRVQRKTIRQPANPTYSSDCATKGNIGWRLLSQVCEGTRKPECSSGVHEAALLFLKHATLEGPDRRRLRYQRAPYREPGGLQAFFGGLGDGFE
jgi:hypothetical protein